MMKFKHIELNGTYKVVYFDAGYAIYDEKGRQIYYEDSDGEIFDKRVKELTIEKLLGYKIKVKELTIKQIEKLLGYKIKVKGE